MKHITKKNTKYFLVDLNKALEILDINVIENRQTERLI